jgi:TRAP-type transport system periplasmic protein
MKSLIRAITIAAVASVALATATFAQAQAEFKIRWAHYLPNADFLKIEKDFAAAINERTNGRVEIEIAYAGGLGKAGEVLTLAGRGAIDMASAPAGYYADQLLFWRATQMPFVFGSTAEAVSVVVQSYKEMPFFAEDLDKMGLQFLFQQPLGSYYLTGPSADCSSIAGLSGKKIRSFGADVPKVHAAVGGTPVTIGTTDIYEALQRGTLDYSFLSRGVIAANKWYEVGKYNCGPVMSIAGHVIVMGKKTWDKLPADIQAIFMEEAAKSQSAYVKWSDEYEGASQKLIESKGGEFIEISDDDMASWKAAAPDSLANWVADMTERGRGDDAELVAKRWGEMIADFRASN